VPSSREETARLTCDWISIWCSVYSVCTVACRVLTAYDYVLRGNSGMLEATCDVNSVCDTVLNYILAPHTPTPRAVPVGYDVCMGLGGAVLRCVNYRNGRENENLISCTGWSSYLLFREGSEDKQDQTGREHEHLIPTGWFCSVTLY
jgi:hypothetical protein